MKKQAEAILAEHCLMRNSTSRVWHSLHNDAMQGHMPQLGLLQPACPWGMGALAEIALPAHVASAAATSFALVIHWPSDVVSELSMLADGEAGPGRPASWRPDALLQPLP